MTRPRALRSLSLLAPLLALACLVGWSQLSAQDDELSWFRADRDEVALYHSSGQIRADDLADDAQGAYDLVSNLIETEISGDIVVIVWPEGADPSDPTQLPPDLDEDARLVHVVRNSGGDVRSGVTNELLNEATGQYAAELPFWFRSAMGFWSQGPLPGFYLRRAGSVAVLDHEEYYTLEQLETFPTTWQFQAKYFGQAGGMLSWMIQDWGPEALVALLAGVRQGLPFYDSLEATYEIPQERFIDEFTKNAERALGLLWPYIEEQSPPFYERLTVFTIFLVIAAVPLAILLFFIGKRMFYD